MKLFEFFGTLGLDNPSNEEKKEDHQLSLEQESHLKNDLFFYILDHDDLHRRQFHDIAETVIKDKDSKPAVWLPLVNKGCMEFYRHHKMNQDPKDIFHKELRDEICHMLDDHYRKDILKGEYHL